MLGQQEDFPNGIEECGTDALRFALVAYTSQVSFRCLIVLYQVFAKPGFFGCLLILYKNTQVTIDGICYVMPYTLDAALCPGCLHLSGHNLLLFATRECQDVQAANRLHCNWLVTTV